MKIAIYARKSKSTDKGESIDNQITSCKDYILKWSNKNSANVEFIIYKDDGFTGSNTSRPQFQKLLADAKKNKFTTLICYRLDRVSRSVADFSTTYELLQEHGIEFISVKEQFDTSTPIGRAMLNIAMVFAQLERETITERITDNMMALAKTGRWLGGTTPAGFVSEPIEYIDHDMNSKKMFKLTEDKNEIRKVQTIFDKFLELKSLRSTESYLLVHDIYTRKNCKYTADTIKDILKNPVYVAADERVYDHLSSLGCQICNPKNEFDGTYGLMVYNKTDQSKSNMTNKDYSEWIVSIGKHHPAISSDNWILVQDLLQANTQNSFYIKETMQYGLLTNLIRCGCCGARMKIKKGKINSKGELSYTYVCTTKEMSRRTKCNVKNIIGQEVDADVVTYLLELANDDSFMNQTLASHKLTITKSMEETAEQIKSIQEEIAEHNTSISNLMSQLQKLSPESSLVSIYMNQLAELDTTIQELKGKLEALQTTESKQQTIELNLDSVRHALSKLKYLEDTADLKIQRSIIRSIIDYITWDGENLHIELFGQELLREKMAKTLENATIYEKCDSTHLCSHSKCDSNC